MAIQKRIRNGKTTYLVRLRDRYGQWLPTKSFTKKSLAVAFEKELFFKRDSESIQQKRQAPRMRFGDFWQKWSEERRSETSEGWIYTQDQMARDYILPLLEKKEMRDIEPSAVGAVLSRMEKLGRGSQTRRHVYNLLHKVFEDATDYYRVVERNPVSSRDRPTVRVTQTEAISPENAFRILNRTRNEGIGAAVWIALLAGLRTSEIQALRWRNVDLENRVIHIVEAYKRKAKKIEPYPKQVKHGQAPISKLLCSFLMDLRKGEAPDEFVIKGIRGEMLNHGTFLRSLKRFCEELNIPAVSPHSLRHGCTEIWIRMGATEEDIIRLLNHSGAGAVRKYIHKSNNRLLEIGESITENSLLNLKLVSN